MLQGGVCDLACYTCFYINVAMLMNAKGHDSQVDIGTELNKSASKQARYTGRFLGFASGMVQATVVVLEVLTRMLRKQITLSGNDGPFRLLPRVLGLSFRLLYTLQSGLQPWDTTWAPTSSLMFSRKRHSRACEKQNRTQPRIYLFRKIYPTPV